MMSMAELIFIGLNVFDAWLIRIDMGLGAIDINPLTPPFMANLLARSLIAIVVVVTLNPVRKENLLWWANIVLAGVLSWHLAVFITSLLKNFLP